MEKHIEDYDLSGCSEKMYMVKECGKKEEECETEYLKKPCRCGGTKFHEPKMRRTNCFPSRCCVQPCCSGVRCCCECNCTCSDEFPCRCGESA